MKLFKLSFKEIVFIFLFASPIALFIYINNYDRAKYEIIVNYGFASSENFCESYQPYRIKLLSNNEIDQITQSYRKDLWRLTANFIEPQLKIISQNDLDRYLIQIRASATHHNLISDLLPVIGDAIKKQELTNFESRFASIKLHCKNANVNFFKLDNSGSTTANIQMTKRYNFFSLAFLMLVPFMIIYLLLFCFRYLKYNFHRIM